MMYRILAPFATSSVHPALYTVPVRTVGISPRTSFPTVCYLPAVVLQVWDSASSRLRADFHRSAHIASVVPKMPYVYFHMAFLLSPNILFQLINPFLLRKTFSGTDSSPLIKSQKTLLLSSHTKHQNISTQKYYRQAKSGKTDATRTV